VVSTCHGGFLHEFVAITIDNSGDCAALPIVSLPEGAASSLMAALARPHASG
jgi:hypothetical protein